MTFAHIVAVAANQTIGQDNDLPWDIPEDMDFFKKTTIGHTIIMGRKTYDSMGRPLPKRVNIIISRQKDLKIPNASVVASVAEAVAFCEKNQTDFKSPIYIIGGGEIYRQTLSIVDIIYLTRIHSQFDGTAKYPELDESVFSEVARKEGVTNNPPYTFLTYHRTRQKKFS